MWRTLLILSALGLFGATLPGCIYGGHHHHHDRDRWDGYGRGYHHYHGHRGWD